MRPAGKRTIPVWLRDHASGCSLDPLTFLAQLEETQLGFRFRRSVKLLPGVRLNVGKRGSSLSIGGRGATMNVGPKGVRTTVGLPGTGLSYTKLQPWAANPASRTGATSPAPATVNHTQPSTRQTAPLAPSNAPPPGLSPMPRVSNMRLVVLGVLWAAAVAAVSNGAAWLLWSACPVLAFLTWRALSKST